MAPLPLKTPQVAALLGCEYHQLFSLIRRHKIKAPARDAGGIDYLWSEADVDAARAALSGTGRLRGALRELVAKTADPKVKRWLVRLVEDPAAAELLPDLPEPAGAAP